MGGGVEELGGQGWGFNLTRSISYAFAPGSTLLLSPRQSRKGPTWKTNALLHPKTIADVWRTGKHTLSGSSEQDNQNQRKTHNLEKKEALRYDRKLSKNVGCGNWRAFDRSAVRPRRDRGKRAQKKERRWDDVPRSTALPTLAGTRMIDDERALTLHLPRTRPGSAAGLSLSDSPRHERPPQY